MPRLTLDQAHDALPQLDELRPIFDHLLMDSTPDPDRAWSGSGRLGTIGSRLIPKGSVSRAVARLARQHADRVEAIYRAVARALEALESGDGTAAAGAFLEAAALEERDDRPDRAEAYAEAAYRAACGAQDEMVAALALRRSARAARARGKLSDALDRYARSHETARAASDARGAAEAAVGAGNVLEDQGRWPEAATWYRSALAAVESVEDPVPERWHAELCLHIVARSQGAIDESLSWLSRAAETAASVDPASATPFVENARGQLSMAQGAFVDAESHLRRAVDSMTTLRGRVTMRVNLAEAMLASGRTLDAAEQAREAEREAIRGALMTKLPEVYRVLGRIASAEGDPDAFVLFERAISIIRENGLPTIEEAQTLQAYAEAEARAGDVEAAEELRGRALERFRALGISQLRQTWADVFGPATRSQPGKGDSHAD